jgi:hypothetical protein
VSIKTIKRTSVGLGVAVAGLLAVAQSQVGDFDLRPGVKYLLIGIIAVILAAITAWAGAKTARASALEEERALESALAGRVQHVEDRDPFDLGVRPAPPGSAYLPRAEDRTLDEALTFAYPEHDAAMVLVVGPANAGKTRSAYEAISRKLPQAMLLAPVDGSAVGKLLAQRDRFCLGTDRQAILWLDSLERYFEQLDLDALDELLFSTPTKAPESGRSGPRKLLRSLKRWIVDLWSAPEEPFAAERQARRQVTVVATIREDALKDALERDDAVGQVARRFTARMQTVHLAVSGNPRHSTVQALTMQASVRPAAFQKSPPPTDGRGLLVILACVLVALSLGLWIVEKHGGWKVPPSLPDQVSKLEDSLQACQTPYESPEASKLHEGSTWVLVVSNKDCPGSDVLRYYTVEEGRLVEQFNESPASHDRWEFTCLGPQPSSCLVHVPGVGPVAIGAFRDSSNGQMLALALYKSAGTVRLYAPFLPPPSTSTGAKRHAAALTRTLELHPGAPYSPEPDTPTPLCLHPAQLCSDPAEFLTVITQGDTHPLIVLGTVSNGTSINPLSLALHVFALQYADKRLHTDPRECLFYSNGIQVPSKQEITLRPTGGNVSTQVRNWWTAHTDKKEGVIC